MRSVNGESGDFSDAAEQQIRDLLAAQPRPTMPPGVQDRILMALAAEPRPDFGNTGRRSPRLMWLGAAVAAAVVVLAGVIVVPQWSQNSTPVSADTSSQVAPPAGVARPAALECAPDPLTYDSGTRYQQAALTTQAQALMPTACRTAAAGSDPTAQSSESPATGEPTATYAPMAPNAAERILDCVVRVAHSAQVVVLDRGFYEDTPAVVAIVSPPTRALAVDCRGQRAQLLMDVPLP